jgi:hypothetical protein
MDRPVGEESNPASESGFPNDIICGPGGDTTAGETGEISEKCDVAANRVPLFPILTGEHDAPSSSDDT